MSRLPRTIVWSNTALDAFEEALTYFAERDPQAADDLVSAVEAAIGRLARRNTGRTGRVPGTFEKSLPKWRYIIAFELREAAGVDELVVLHLVHTSRDWKKGKWPK